MDELINYLNDSQHSEDVSVELSYLIESSRCQAVKRQLCDLQFVAQIFDYFDPLARLKCQALNKRMYHGIMPHWLRSVPLLTYQWSDPWKKNPHPDLYFQFPTPETLANTPLLQLHRCEIMSIQMSVLEGRDLQPIQNGTASITIASGVSSHKTLG